MLTQNLAVEWGKIFNKGRVKEHSNVLNAFSAELWEWNTAPHPFWNQKRPLERGLDVGSIMIVVLVYRLISSMLKLNIPPARTALLVVASHFVGAHNFARGDLKVYGTQTFPSFDQLF
ncbi:hypothetical protein AMS62_11800 [Bacillus sp. FJAT-18019]|nr:hypothetical protein AMS62_11800 [Bacillus sp. FJAT-18019]